MRPPRRHRRLGDPGPLPRVPARRPGRAARSRSSATTTRTSARSLACWSCSPAATERRSATDGAGRRPRRPRPGLRPGRSPRARPSSATTSRSRRSRRSAAAAPVACGQRTVRRPPEPAGEVPWWSPRVPADFGGSPRPHIGSAPSVRSAAFATPWTTDRIAVERAHLLRRLRRWDDAAEAWASLAAGPGRTAIVAAIELAKLREHRLRDPLGALRADGRRPRPRRAAPAARPPEPRLEADLRARARRLRRRLVGRTATVSPRGRPAADAGRGSPLTSATGRDPAPDRTSRPSCAGRRPAH